MKFKPRIRFLKEKLQNQLNGYGSEVFKHVSKIISLKMKKLKSSAETLFIIINLKQCVRKTMCIL